MTDFVNLVTPGHFRLQPLLAELPQKSFEIDKATWRPSEVEVVRFVPSFFSPELCRDLAHLSLQTLREVAEEHDVELQPEEDPVAGLLTPILSTLSNLRSGRVVIRPRILHGGRVWESLFQPVMAEAITSLLEDQPDLPESDDERSQWLLRSVLGAGTKFAPDFLTAH